MITIQPPVLSTIKVKHLRPSLSYKNIPTTTLSILSIVVKELQKKISLYQACLVRNFIMKISQIITFTPYNSKKSRSTLCYKVSTGYGQSNYKESRQAVFTSASANSTTNSMSLHRSQIKSIFFSSLHYVVSPRFDMCTNKYTRSPDYYLQQQSLHGFKKIAPFSPSLSKIFQGDTGIVKAKPISPGSETLPRR